MKRKRYENGDMIASYCKLGSYYDVIILSSHWGKVGGMLRAGQPWHNSRFKRLKDIKAFVDSVALVDITTDAGMIEAHKIFEQYGTMNAEQKTDTNTSPTAK